MRDPAKERAVPKTKVPFTAENRMGRMPRCSPLRSRRPHVFHRMGKSALDGHCKGPPRTNSRRTFEEAAPFRQPVAPWPDDPSARDRLGRRRGYARTECLARSMPTAAPQRLLRPRARSPMCRELHGPFMPDRRRLGNRKFDPTMESLSTDLSTSWWSLFTSALSSLHNCHANAIGPARAGRKKSH